MKKKPKNISHPYKSKGIPVYRDTTALPFKNGGELLAQPYPNSFFASDLGNYYADGGPLHDRDNETGKLLNSTYASALGSMFRDGGYFDRGYSLPEDSFRQGGRGLKDSIYASTSGQYPAPYRQGGNINVVAGGEKHRVYVKKSPTGIGEGIQGHVMVNHPTMNKGQWDTIDLTEKAGAKTVAQGIAATKKWHKENPNSYKQGGSILSMSNTPQLEGEGKDLNYPSKGYAYAKGGMIKRADGSYSKRGLWDNIRANKGSGKKPTKAMLAQEKKINANTYDVGGPIYTYAGRPDAQYKKVNDKWFISAPGTNGFIPVSDPSGKRTALLNKQAVVQPRAKNYNPLLQPTTPSETLQNVAKNTMQAENLNQYSQNIDRSIAVKNVKDPGFMYKSMDANQLAQFITPELQGNAEALVKQGMFNSIEDAQRDLLIAKEEQKFATPGQQANAWNNYNDAPVESTDWMWALPLGASAVPAALEGLAGLAGTEILGSGLTAGNAADIYFGAQGVGNLTNAVEAQRQGDTETRNAELLNAGLNLGVPVGLGALSGAREAARQSQRLGLGNVATGKASISDIFKRDDLVNFKTVEDLAAYEKAVAEGTLSPTRNRYYSSLKDNPDAFNYAKGQEQIFVHRVPQTKAAAAGKSLANIKPEGAGLIARQRSIPTIADVDSLIASGKLSGYSDETLQGLREVAANPEGYQNLDIFKSNPELQTLVKDPNLVNPAEHLLPRPAVEDFTLMPIGAIGASRPALIEGKEILNQSLQGMKSSGKVPTTSTLAEDDSTTFKSGGAMNFKSKGAYQNWLAYGHASGEFAKTPGHQKVSIKGKAKKVEHEMGGNLYDVGGDIGKALSKNARISVSPYNQDYNSILAARDLAYQLNPVTHGYGLGYDKRIQLSKDPRFKTRVGANISIPYGANQAPTVQGTFQGDYYSGIAPGSMGSPMMTTKVGVGYDPNKKLNAYLEAMPRWEFGNISTPKKAQDKYYKGDWTAYAGPMGGIGMQIDRGNLLASTFYGAGAGFQAQPFRAPLRIGADARLGFQAAEGKEYENQSTKRGDKRSLIHNARVYASYPLDKLGRDIKRGVGKIDWPDVEPLNIPRPDLTISTPPYGGGVGPIIGDSPIGFLPGYSPETGRTLTEKEVQQRYNYTAPAENNFTMENPSFKYGGGFNNPGFKALPGNVQAKIKANSFADGGPMAQLTEFNAGGTHEQNPIGGIPQGMAPNGQVNLVEQGETKLNSEDYVFSDSLKVDKETVNAFGLSKNLIGKTFADASKTLNRPTSRRENDTIEENAIKRDLDNLMGAQEFYKQEQVDNKLQELQSLAPDLYNQMMQGMQSYQPMEMGQGMPGEMTEQEVMMDETGQPVDPNQIPPEMLAQMPEAQAGMPVMAYGGHMYKCGGKMYNFGGQMYNMGGNMYNYGGNMYNYGGRMFEGGGGLTAEEKARLAQGSYLASTGLPTVKEKTAAEKAAEMSGQIGQYAGLAAQGVNAGMTFADKNATAEQKADAAYNTGVGIASAINPVVGGLIQVGDMIGQPLKENVFEKYNDEGELQNENTAKAGAVLGSLFNPFKAITTRSSYEGGWTDFTGDKYVDYLEDQKKKELGISEDNTPTYSSQLGAVMNSNSMNQGGYLVPQHSYKPNYPTYKDNAGPQGQPLTNLYAEGGELGDPPVSVYNYNPVPKRTDLNFQGSYFGTPEGFYPIPTNNKGTNKPIIIEKGSKYVSGSPYADNYSRFKEYQADNTGKLRSVQDESYYTNNVGGERVVSVPQRYVTMDTLGYSQGRENFPVRVVEKNIADGFGGSYDVNEFEATRAQVPSLIKSMKNQTGLSNKEKVAANAYKVEQNRKKVEANKEKVRENQRRVLGLEMGGQMYADGGQMYNESLASYDPAAFNMLGMGQHLGQQMYEPLDHIEKYGGRLMAEGGMLGDPPPTQQYFANPEDEYLAEFLNAEANKFGEVVTPPVTPAAPIGVPRYNLGEDYESQDLLAKYPSGTGVKPAITAKEVLEQGQDQDELIKLQNDVLNAETQEELDAATAAYQSALQRLNTEMSANNVDMTIQRKLPRDLMMFAPAAYNIGTGLFEKANQLNPANYMVRADLQGTEMNIEPIRRRIQQNYAQALNAVRNAGASGGSYMTNVQQLASNQNAAVSQAEIEKQNADMLSAERANMANKQIESTNKQTQQQIEETNRRAKAMKRAALTTGLTQIADIAKGAYDLDAQKALAKAISPTFGDKFGVTNYKQLQDLIDARNARLAEKDAKKKETTKTEEK